MVRSGLRVANIKLNRDDDDPIDVILSGLCEPDQIMFMFPWTDLSGVTLLAVVYRA